MRARKYNPAVAQGFRWYPEDIVGGRGGTKGHYWFVDGDKSAGGGGRSWEDAFSTFGAAVTALTDDDVIFVAPGNYNEGVTHVITEDNVKIIGTGGPGVSASSVLASWASATDGGDEDILHLDGDNIEVANIRFHVGEGNYVGVGLGGTTDPVDCWIHDCYFYSAGIGSGIGVEAGRRDESNGNAISWLIENNTFFKNKISLMLDGSRAQVKNNHFIITHPYTGISCPQSGSQRNSNVITDNTFSADGTANEQTGITFTGASSPTAGTMFVDYNQFTNFASATYACDKLDTYGGGNNWLGDQFLTDANPPTATARV